MTITEKELKQLNQLDRIEFRQRRDGLEANHNLVFDVLLLFFTGFSFLFAVDVLSKGLVPISSFSLFAELCLGLLALAIILDFVVFPGIVEYKIRQIENEYFNFKTETKSKARNKK